MSPRFFPALVPLALLTLAGCAVGSGSPEDDGAALGQTSAALTDWEAGGHASTDEASGADLGVPGNTWTCFLSGVAGDVKGTSQGDPGQYQARAGVVRSPFFNTWRAYGHGATDLQGAWLGNRVQARATCVPHPRVATGTWASKVDVVAPPVRIADIANGTRRCFLGETLGDPFGPFGSSARVSRVVFPDATHPTPGFYVEASVRSSPGSLQNKVSASCVDFPEGTTFETTAVAGPATGSATFPVGSSLVGKKACGLVEIGGNFSESSYTDGVLVKAPTTDDGAWSVTVAAGKRGTVLCAK